MNARELSNITCQRTNEYATISYAPYSNDYNSNFRIAFSPTANCQLSCGVGIGPIGNLSRDHLRHLLVTLRINHASRRILLMDIKERHAVNIIKNLSPTSIISNTPYISTNGSYMNILLVRLSSVRQLKGAKVVPVIATK
jgi:hypothetical protein